MTPQESLERAIAYAEANPGDVMAIALSDYGIKGDIAILVIHRDNHDAVRRHRKHWSQDPDRAFLRHPVCRSVKDYLAECERLGINRVIKWEAPAQKNWKASL